MIFLAEIREKMYYLPEATPDFIAPLTIQDQLTFLLFVLVILTGIAWLLRHWGQRKNR